MQSILIVPSISAMLAKLLLGVGCIAHQGDLLSGWEGGSCKCTVKKYLMEGVSYLS